MADFNRRLPKIDASRFSMVPRADIPRSTFVTTHSVKSTFNAGDLVPIHIDEVLPGDVHQGNLTIFARLATPLFPIMDQLELETFFFFIPCRLLWVNWKKMMGERANPADSISYTIPQIVADPATVLPGSLYDFFGIPGAGQVDGAASKSISALPFRAYNLVWSEWFRDQNLQNTLILDTDDGPDTPGNYVLMKRNKKHDYFTSALPWPLKGGVEVSTPIGGWAAVKGIATQASHNPADGTPDGTYYETGGTPSAPVPVNPSGWLGYFAATTPNVFFRAGSAESATPMIYADLASASGITINALRLAVQTQRLLERDARSGTRYTELLKSHFGVQPEDVRLQRPEYIGGGRIDIKTSAIAQTSATGLTGGSSPLGALGAAAIASDQHSFTYRATEHGYILGLVNVRAELTYQQGLHRMWTRLTRYDFYWPAFAHLGEQVVRNDEIYAKGDNQANELTAFGYQERWAEYRHRPSRISGLFRSTAAGTIDPWHLAEEFATRPALNGTFIREPAQSTVERVLAAGAQALNMQILFDSIFRIRTTRPMPMYSVPGMMDHF